MSDEKSVKKTGRPKGSLKINFNEEELRRVETLAGYGLNQTEVASVIGICPRTLLKYKDNSEAFNAAWTRGKQKAKAYVAGKLMQKIDEGDLPAIKWYEQTRCGLSEKIQTESQVTHKVQTIEQFLRGEKDVGPTSENALGDSEGAKKEVDSGSADKPSG